VFQSLDWVERLSDPESIPPVGSYCAFQSLDWVERLSDVAVYRRTAGSSEFQSLDWVERLSDPAQRPARSRLRVGFNPSTGLSVFQTTYNVTRDVAGAVSIPRLG